MSTFIAQLFPRDKVKDIQGASQAGINFCHNFIEAIDPEMVYAYQLNSVKEKLNPSFENKKIKYVASRTFPHKHIYKVINVLTENYLIIRDVVNRKLDNIWFYNMTPQVMLIFCILKFLFGKKCFVVVADFTPELFRNKLALQMLRRANGIISLSSELKHLVNNQTQLVVKAGIVNNYQESKAITPSRKTKFLFSGSLSKYTGIELALQAFSELPNLQLYISGRGESEKLISEYCSKFKNIHFEGFLSFDDYLILLDSVECVLSLRDTSLGKNLYNFPSKIVEYFIAKKLVVSTKKYHTLDDNTYIYCEYSKESLKTSISHAMLLPESVFSGYQHRAFNFAASNFSFASWKETVKSLENQYR